MLGKAHWGSQALPPKLAEMHRMLGVDRAATVEAWVKDWYGVGVSDAMRAWTVRQILESGPHIDVLFDELAGYDPRPAMATATVPMFFVHGRDDIPVPLHVAVELADLTPGARLVVIDGAGHMPHQEQPAATNDALRRFLASLPGASRV